MKCSIYKYVLEKALKNVQGIVKAKTNYQITNNVLVAASVDNISICATDFQTGFDGSYRAEIELSGDVVVNGKKLYEIVKSFPSMEIFLSEEGDCLKISDGNVEHRIMCVSREDFPSLPLINDDFEVINVDSSQFKSMIDKSLVIGCDSGEKRPHINGVFFHEAADAESTIRMVSTDGSRLSRVDIPFDGEFETYDVEGLLIPKKGLSEVSKFLSDEGEVSIGFKDNHIIISRDGETINIRLMEGDFPRYSGIVTRKDGSDDIEIDRKPFLASLKRMSILADSDTPSSLFSFNEDNLEITTTNPELGESKENLQIDSELSGMKFVFDPTYFIDTLNAIKEDTVVLSMKDLKNPCLVRGKEDLSFLTAIMPMKI